VKTTNPVLSRLGQAAERERTAGYNPAGPYGPAAGQPGYGQPYPSADSGYPAAPPAVQPMTVDDVVVKTVMLLGITGISAVAAWNLVPDALLGPVWIGAAIVGLVLGLIISFSRMANPALVVTYAVVEGAFVGLVSKLFESFYNGIVLQAVVATFGVFFLMAVLYKARVIRATKKFVRGMIAVMAGLFFVMLINFVLAMFGVNTGLRDGSPLAIVFSLVCIGIAAFSFLLDFDQADRMIREGMPSKWAWYAAFGLMTTLVWLYLEILRLLSYLRE